MRILLDRAPRCLGVAVLAAIVATCGSVSVKSGDGGAGAGGKDASTSGSAGATGASGAVGSAGAIGTAGATAAAGTMGSAGAMGTAGETGNAGSGPRDGASADATGTGGSTGATGAGGLGGPGGSSGGSGGSGGSSGTCLRAKGCCANDNDCIAADECVGGTCSATMTSAGVCEPKPTGKGCWSNADCSVLTPTCNGPFVCKCGEECVVADKMGTCALILSDAALDGLTSAPRTTSDRAR